jgi:phage-related protein
VKVRFYQSAAGRSPVADYLREVPSDRAEEVFAVLADLEAHGLDGSEALARHIEGKLWELKFPTDRIFYVILTGPEMVLLHAYKKQGQKAPKRELDVARKRMKEILP